MDSILRRSDGQVRPDLPASQPPGWPQDARADRGSHAPSGVLRGHCFSASSRRWRTISARR